jgi:hypothetical protein
MNKNAILLATATLALLARPSTAVAAEPAVTWECPEGYQVREGLNVDFPHKGVSTAGAAKETCVMSMG